MIVGGLIDVYIPMGEMPTTAKIINTNSLTVVELCLY